jgi:antirestriction protein ArdC
LCRYRHKSHWTRHPSRLDRDFGRKRYGDEGYAMEELAAELGSAFLSADLDLTPKLRGDHASYISSWIKILKDDWRAIFTSARRTSRTACRNPHPSRRTPHRVRHDEAGHHPHWRPRLGRRKLVWALFSKRPKIF